MRTSVTLCAFVLSLGLAATADAGEIKIAQHCGYFAILGCYHDRAAAEDWAARIDDGHVINTSSMHFTNFRPGWFCVAHGPASRGEAEEVARGWRRVIPQAYVKSSC